MINNDLWGSGDLNAAPVLLFTGKPFTPMCPRENIPRNKYISRLLGYTLIPFNPTRFEWRTDHAPPVDRPPLHFLYYYAPVLSEPFRLRAAETCVKPGIKCDTVTAPNSLFFPRPYIIGVFHAVLIIATRNVIAHSA